MQIDLETIESIAVPIHRVRIVRVQIDELDPGPLPRPFSDGTGGPYAHWKLHWMRLTSDDGLIGQAPGWNLPLDEMNALARMLLDSGNQTLEQWWHKLFWMRRNAGQRCPSTSHLIANVDMALNDICARRAELPWHRFKGAMRDEVPVYACGGSTDLSRSELVAECRELVREGFDTIKIKVGTRFGSCMAEDEERVRAVRAAIGPDIRLAVDANQAWNAIDAITFARRIEDLDIAWFEEPVHSADRYAIRQVCGKSPIPIAMGESENHWLGYRDLIDCGVSHLQVGPEALPGYDRWRDALAYAEQHDLAWSAGGLTHLTAMYVATRPNGTVEYLRGIIGHLASCWSVKPVLERNVLRLPMTPGLSVQVNWEGLHDKRAITPIIDTNQS